MKTPRQPRRRGLAIVPALVCLLLVTMLCAAMLRLAHTQRGAGRDEERRIQAEWLAEAGAGLASARLSADGGYQGQTWDVPARSLGGVGPGRVTIVVEPLEKSARRRSVRVEAEYPRGETHRARHTKHLTVDLETEKPGDPS